MGTPSMIGIWNSETNTVTASYCHYDGYLEGNGRTLVEYYNDPVNAKIVSEGGYLSALNENYSACRAQSAHFDPAVVFESVESYMKDGYADYLYLYDGENWFFSKNGSGFEEVEMNLGRNL
jgi:hypothetical protein